MGDMAEVFHDMRDASRERRAHNRHNSTDILRANSIVFEAKNHDAHLIVTHAGHTVDFWPGTGKWIVRPMAAQGRGVFGMLRYLGVKI